MRKLPSTIPDIHESIQSSERSCSYTTWTRHRSSLETRQDTFETHAFGSKVCRQYNDLHPGYLLSCHVPPSPELFSKIMKLRQLLRLTKSIAVHMPEIPAPTITTAALLWFLFPIGTSGYGWSPAIAMLLLNSEIERAMGRERWKG